MYKWEEEEDERRCEKEHICTWLSVGVYITVERLHVHLLCEPPQDQCRFRTGGAKTLDKVVQYQHILTVACLNPVERVCTSIYRIHTLTNLMCNEL